MVGLASRPLASSSSVNSQSCCCFSNQKHEFPEKKNSRPACCDFIPHQNEPHASEASCRTCFKSGEFDLESTWSRPRLKWGARLRTCFQEVMSQHRKGETSQDEQMVCRPCHMELGRKQKPEGCVRLRKGVVRRACCVFACHIWWYFQQKEHSRKHFPCHVWFSCVNMQMRKSMRFRCSPTSAARKKLAKTSRKKSGKASECKKVIRYRGVIIRFLHSSYVLCDQSNWIKAST